MCCCGRNKKNDESYYNTLLVDSELIVRQTELTEDLVCAVTEAAVFGTVSSGVLVVGACTGTISLLIPSVISTTVSTGIAIAKVSKIYGRLELTERLLHNRKIS
jgi:hypothetical protein